MAKHKPKAGARRCSYEWPEDLGRACKAYAIRDSEFCRVHNLTPQERVAEASRMGQRRAMQRRSQTEARPRSDIAPGISLAEVLRVIADGLKATDPFLPDQPLWPVRLASAGTLLAGWPSYYRRTPEEVNELLRQVIPDRVYDSSRYEATKVFAALRESWLRVEGLRWSKIHGLYTKPFPGWMIEPWLSDREVRELQRSRPAPDPRAPVHHLGGTVALERPHALPLSLPVEEPDEEDIFVDTGAVLPY